MSNIKIVCEKCNASYQVDPDKLPRKIVTAKCKKCGASIEISKDKLSQKKESNRYQNVKGSEDYMTIGGDDFIKIDELIKDNKLGVANNFCAQLLHKRKSDAAYQGYVRLKIAEINDIKSKLLNDAIARFEKKHYLKAKINFDQLIEQFPLMESELFSYLEKIEYETIGHNNSKVRADGPHLATSTVPLIHWIKMSGIVIVVLLIISIAYIKIMDTWKSDNKSQIVNNSNVLSPETDSVLEHKEEINNQAEIEVKFEEHDEAKFAKEFEQFEEKEKEKKEEDLISTLLRLERESPRAKEDCWNRNWSRCRRECYLPGMPNTSHDCAFQCVKEACDGYY